ncbi:family 16 glycosylhydrolase [Limnohabitans sp. B9-3]|uniref:glycoside hydrolase family 16 protein n=1 Tax=Limnohabitans sp. B9-3 TaxID=1100707 RepID=UPI00117AF980|nr:glycoside hydrolase family 16 protein [Limnohabitans sp. B9-3]
MFTRSKFKLAILSLASLTACGGGGGGGDLITAVSLDLTLPSAYILKWSDEFSLPGSPSSTWSYDIGSPLLGGSVWGNAEKQYYTAQAKNSFIDANGQLVIQPVVGITADDMAKGDSANQPDVLSAIQARGVSVTSARMHTNTPSYFAALNSTPYGFYEIRAKVPCVAGAWPAIWMMGRAGVWPARGEIDIMEWFGGQFTAQPNQVQSGVHSTTNHWGTSAGLLYAKANVANMCTEFHKFQLHWSANEILMGVDGTPTFSFKRPANATSDNWPFSQPAFVLLNVAVGGNLGGVFNAGDLPNMTMKVDYVKVWQPPS